MSSSDFPQDLLCVSGVALSLFLCYKYDPQSRVLIHFHQWKGIPRMATPEEEFAAFKVWQAQQGTATAVVPENETPPVSIAEVLHALVNSAQFHTEATARAYHEAIDAHYGTSDEETEKATDAT
jgi:hypothetical protein